MTDRTEIRISRILRKIQQYKRRREDQLTFFSAVCSLFLFIGIEFLLKMVQTPVGIAASVDGYGAVLLQDGGGAYVLIGITGFAVGMALTILCIRCKKKSKHKNDK